MAKAAAAFFLLSGALTLSFGAGPAKAQSASTQADTGGIEEIVVTATRREEKISKVPESISAFSSADMEHLDAKNIGDLVRFTPGVTYNPVSKDISIRGVNSTAGDATTGIYIDDTPIQLRALGFGSDNTLPAVFDLERVEVLRGPQGTLFGAGSEGGTVRYITPAPSLTDYGVYAKTELADTENGAPSYEAGVAVGGPIVDDKLGFRISGWARHDGGWIDKVDYMTGQTLQSNTNYADTYVVRAAVNWQVTSDLSITPSVFYQNRHQNNLDQYWLSRSNPNNGDFKTATPENMGDRDNFTLPALKIDWDFGGAELISDTSYFDRHEVVQDYSGTLYNLSYFQRSESARYNPDYVTPCTGGLCFINPQVLLTPTGINLPAYDSTQAFGHYKSVNYVTNGQQNFTQEVRLQSDDPNASLTWIVGVFWSLQSQLSVEEINDPQLPQLTQYLWGQSVTALFGEGLLANGDDYINHTQDHERQYAAFANATYAITDQLKLQAGLRIAKTHFDFSNFSDGAQNFGPLFAPGGKKDETPFTPMGSLSYQITPDDLLYATVSKGYRIGGANPLFPISACTETKVEPLTYGSDTVLNYEAGSKDKFMDGKVQISGSVYYLQWSNIQQSVTLPSCAFRYTTNLGSAESKGLDVQGDFVVTDDFDVGFSLGYTEAHYTSTSMSAGLTLARSGDKLPGSPWTFSIDAQYRKNIWNHDFYLSLEDEFQSAESSLTPPRDRLTSLYDGALVPNPATNVLTLRAGTQLDNMDISIFADNVLNTHPQLDLTHQDSQTLLFEASTLRPRTIGVTASYRY